MTNDNQNKIYITPRIECIKLDNEISLTLDSTPPGGPGEPTGYAPDHFNNDPFKTNQA